jgi:acyl carrier protein
MNPNNNEVKLRECLKRAGVIDQPIDLQEDLEPYGYDSLVKALLVIEVEREFKIKVVSHQLSSLELKTLKDFMDLIQKFKPAP